MFTTRPAHRTATGLLVPLALLVAACGESSDAGDASETAEPTPIESSAPATDVDAPAETVPATTATTSADDGEPATDTTTGGTDDGTTTQEEIEVLTLPAGPAEFPILGGIELELPEPSRVLQGTGCILIEQPGYTGSSPFPPTVALAGVVASGFGVPSPISTIDEWLALYEGQPEPTPNGETLSVLGLELEGYSVDGAFSDGPPPDDQWLNCTGNDGAVSSLAFIPSNTARVYLAETDDALIVISASAFTAEEFDGLQPMFDQIVSTVQSTET